MFCLLHELLENSQNFRLSRFILFHLEYLYCFLNHGQLFSDFCLSASLISLSIKLSHAQDSIWPLFSRSARQTIPSISPKNYFCIFSYFFLFISWRFFLFTESSVGVVRSKATELIGRAPVFFRWKKWQRKNCECRIFQDEKQGKSTD